MSPDVHLSIFVILETADTLLCLYVTVLPDASEYIMLSNCSLKTYLVKQDETYSTFRNSRRSHGITRLPSTRSVRIRRCNRDPSFPNVMHQKP